MQDTIVCPACKRLLVLPPGVRDITAQCPNCGTQFPSDPPAPEPEPVRPTRASAPPEATAEPAPPHFDATPPAPAGESGGLGNLKWGAVVLGILIGILRMVTAGGEGGKNQAARDQDMQRRLREMQEHANRMDDRADAFARQVKALEEAEAREFRPLFDALRREFGQGDGRQIATSFAADRMAENIPLVRTFDARAKRAFVEKLHRSLPEYFDRHAAGMAWTSLEIQAVGRPADDEAAIATRLEIAGVATRQVRWWLVRRLGRWRVFDVEDLRTGKKLSLSAGFPDAAP